MMMMMMMMMIIIIIIEVFTKVENDVVVRVVPCGSFTGGYQRVAGTYCFHTHFCSGHMNGILRNWYQRTRLRGVNPTDHAIKLCSLTMG